MRDEMAKDTPYKDVYKALKLKTGDLEQYMQSEKLKVGG
jgi:hypothetical protein